MSQAKIKKFLIFGIREGLLKRGHTLASWARARGYDSRRVAKIVYRYSDNPQLPRNPEVYAIIKDLHKDTGIDLTKKAS